MVNSSYSHDTGLLGKRLDMMKITVTDALLKSPLVVATFNQFHSNLAITFLPAIVLKSLLAKRIH